MIQTWRERGTGEAVKAVSIAQFRNDVILDEDVCALNGNVVVAKGHELKQMSIERLNNSAHGIGLCESVRVRIPAHYAGNESLADHERLDVA